MIGRFRCPGGLSEAIASIKGVKQGCPLSLTLFGLYIDEIAKFIDRGGGGGASLQGLLVSLMLYVNDIILMSDSWEGLQRHMNALGDFCTHRGLSENLRKTKVMIFHTSSKVMQDTDITFKVIGWR